MKLLLLCLVACAAIVRAQAMVESGLTTGKAATTTAPASGAGSFFDSLVERIEGIIQSAKPTPPASPHDDAPAVTPHARPAAIAKRAAPAPKAEIAPPPPRVYEDSGAIQTGIAYEDLIRRFGPPTVAVTESPYTTTLLYSGKQGRVELQLQGGKVISVQSRKPPQPSVMLPG